MPLPYKQHCLFEMNQKTTTHMHSSKGTLTVLLEIDQPIHYDVKNSFLAYLDKSANGCSKKHKQIPCQITLKKYQRAKISQTQSTCKNRKEKNKVNDKPEHCDGHREKEVI